MRDLKRVGIGQLHSDRDLERIRLRRDAQRILRETLERDGCASWNASHITNGLMTGYLEFQSMVAFGALQGVSNVAAEKLAKVAESWAASQLSQPVPGEGES